MAWGDRFKSAWNSAKDQARDEVAALATGAQAVKNAAAATIQTLAREAHLIAQTAAKTALKGAELTAKAGLAVAKKTVDAAEWAAEKTRQAAKYAADKAVTGAKAVAKSARAVYGAAKKAFSKAVAGVATAACTAWNWTVGTIGFGVATALSKRAVSNLLRPLLRLRPDESQRKYDGWSLGAGCKQNNPAGVMPAGCKQRRGALPKVTYVNGINTAYATGDDENPFKAAGICKTMQEIANKTCSEVKGVYNATEGIGKDLDECLDNIAKSSASPAVPVLRQSIFHAAKSGTPITVYAHSQGGLITQEAIAQAKLELMEDLTEEEAEERLKVVQVKSFGTAVLGWPKGPEYERYTNTCDPVPPVIAGAQTSYPAETYSDSAVSKTHDVFTDPHGNPIDSHSMDDTYLPRLEKVLDAKEKQQDAASTRRCLCRAA